MKENRKKDKRKSMGVNRNKEGLRVGREDENERRRNGGKKDEGRKKWDRKTENSCK